MNSVVQDVIRQFTKQEVLRVAEELGIQVEEGERSSAIVERLITVDPTTLVGKVSELMYEFLVTAEVIDEKGNVIIKEVKPLQEEQIKQPCFAYADKRDPACQKCKIYDACAKQRIATRPRCYGMVDIFDRRNEECTLCIEMAGCAKLAETK